MQQRLLPPWVGTAADICGAGLWIIAHKILAHQVPSSAVWVTVARMKVIHDIIGVSVAIVVVLRGSRGPEVVQLALKGQWHTIHSRCGLDWTSPVQNSHLVPTVREWCTS